MSGSGRSLKPFRYAALLSGGYALVSAAYIVISGRLAALAAHTVVGLEHIERLKGIAFVATTAILLLGMSWYLFSRLAAVLRERTLDRQAMMLVQRKAFAGELAAAIAHDFNNLLMVVRAGVEELKRSTTGPVETGLIEDIHSALDSGKVLTLRLAATARGQRIVRMDPHVLTELVSETTLLLRRLPRLRGRTVDLRVQPVTALPMDSALVEQIVVNLVLNAADAAGPHGRVEVGVREEPAVIVLEIHDSGPGLPPGTERRIFDPFFSSKAGGLGLGLLSVRAAAEAHGATIVTGRSPLGGALFAIHFPKSVGP